VRERVEATVMKTLASAGEPFCNIPDVGMHLEPRHDDEEAIVAINRCEKLLYALPPQFKSNGRSGRGTEQDSECAVRITQIQ